MNSLRPERGSRSSMNQRSCALTASLRRKCASAETPTEGSGRERPGRARELEVEPQDVHAAVDRDLLPRIVEHRERIARAPVVELRGGCARAARCGVALDLEPVPARDAHARVEVREVGATAGVAAARALDE